MAISVATALLREPLDSYTKPRAQAIHAMLLCSDATHHCVTSR